MQEGVVLAMTQQSRSVTAVGGLEAAETWKLQQTGQNKYMYM